jgi:aryl-alcohol dehydrogenase-like predicted oxidoreductase
MRYVRLGKSDLDVSRLGLDCHSLGIAQRERGWDPFSYDGQVFATRTVHAALDAGINFFDTSSDSGGNRAESLIGKALQGRRESVLLASRIYDVEVGDTIKDRVSATMRRLRADHLDIVYLGDQLGQQQQPLDALNRMRVRGAVRNLGLAVSDPVVAMPLVESGCFEVVELQCDIGDEGPGNDLLDACHRKGMGVSMNKPLATSTIQNLVSALDSEWDGSTKVRECCLKYLLADKRVHLINLGMRWEHEVITNSRLVSAIEPPCEPPGFDMMCQTA